MRGGFGTFESRSKRLQRQIRGFVALILFYCSCVACDKQARISDHDLSAPAAEAEDPAPAATAVTQETPRKYDGLTLDEWQARLKTLGPGVAGAAEAIPGLRAIAEDRAVKPQLRSQATVMLGRLGKPGLIALPTLEKLLQEPPGQDGIPAVWSAKAIALLGPGARDAAPQLIAVLEKPETPLEAQLACLEALAWIGGHHSQAIPAIVRTMKRAARRESPDDDRTLLIATVDACSLIGAGGSVAVPELMELLDYPHDLVRLKVVRALYAIGRSASPAANALAEMLIFDESDDVRREAAFALAAIGPEARNLLFHLAQDEEVSVRKYCVEALGTIMPRNEELVKHLSQALHDESSDVRLVAAIALKDDTSLRSNLMRVLSELIADPDRTVKLSAANQLAAMRPDDKEWEQLRTRFEGDFDRETLRLWERVGRMRKQPR